MTDTPVAEAPVTVAEAPVTLELSAVAAGYGGVEALRGVDIAVRRGQLTALIGPNGAGKSTLLRCITGLMRPRSGEIRLDGGRIDPFAAGKIAALGGCQGPGGRRLFGRQTIADNLLVGGWVQRKNRKQLGKDRDEMY